MSQKLESFKALCALKQFYLLLFIFSVVGHIGNVIIYFKFCISMFIFLAQATSKSFIPILVTRAIFVQANSKTEVRTGPGKS